MQPVTRRPSVKAIKVKTPAPTIYPALVLWTALGLFLAGAIAYGIAPLVGLIARI